MALDLLVAIPGCGLPDLTAALVARLAAEDVPVLVVDNAGDYRRRGHEEVYVPRANLGWLGSSIWALGHAFRSGYASCLLLDNDVTPSRDFCAGLLTPLDPPSARPIGLVGPLIGGSDMGNGQHFACDPDVYVPCPETLDARFLLGTALLVTRRLYEAIGPPDPRFGPSGWGAEVDYGYRARRAGFRAVVSKGGYLAHAGMTTVATMRDLAGYVPTALDQTRSTFRALYGRNWQAVVGFDYGIDP